MIGFYPFAGLVLLWLCCASLVKESFAVEKLAQNASVVCFRRQTTLWPL